MSSRRACVSLVICLVAVGQLAGLCQVVCALSGSDHASMEHRNHVATTATDASMTHGAHAATHTSHCKVCDGPGACSMTRSPLPAHTSMAADPVIEPALVMVADCKTDAPAIRPRRVESRAAPPESQPPRG